MEAAINNMNRLLDRASAEHLAAVQRGDPDQARHLEAILIGLQGRIDRARKVLT